MLLEYIWELNWDFFLNCLFIVVLRSDKKYIVFDFN